MRTRYQGDQSSIDSEAWNMLSCAASQEDEVQPKKLKLMRGKDGDCSNGESSWIANMIETQSEGKGVSISLDCQEEPREKFRLMTQWDNDNSQRGGIYHGFWQLQENTEHKSNGESGNDSMSFGGSNSSSCRKSRERKGAKAEKVISLEVLRQHFAGSLKDAAKSIGVCPTTLKRICRQHGITRWPSRKIKKVGHSLKKLQGVINSVQGPNFPIHLDSFFSSFPKLSPRAPPLSTRQNQNSSCSQSSTSIDSGGTLAVEEEEEEEVMKAKPLQSHRLFGKTIETVSPKGVEFRVKASFGGEKIRFCMQSSWGFIDLQQEIGRRFGIVDALGRIDLKYLDDDQEWVLLTCDADLEECIYVCRMSATDMIRISLHRQASKLNLNS